MITSAELKEFVRRHRRDKHKWLWDIANLAPFGGDVISTDSRTPYLMRVYLTPFGEELERLVPKSVLKWAGVKTPKKLLEKLGLQDVPRLYLHFFFRGDSDREHHNHPAKYALSLILTEGYDEERWNQLKKRIDVRHVPPLTFNVIRDTDFHRVLLRNPEEGCWTLFFNMGREKPADGSDWGFLDTVTEHYTPWAKWIEARKAAV